MTADEAKAVAAFLGGAHRAHLSPGWIGVVRGPGLGVPVDYADLLLALLERSVAKELNTRLEWDWSANLWHARLDDTDDLYSAGATTPLAAMIQAVVKYKEGK